MVNPKKDYELLMRYLQGGALKQKPAAVPEQTYKEDWQPVSPPAQTQAPASPVLSPDKTTPPAPPLTIRRKFNLSWPKTNPVSPAKRFRIATAVLALLVLSFLFWKGYTLYQLSVEKIFDEMYVPFTATGIKATEPDEGNSIDRYYAAGNYVAVTMQSKKQPRLSPKEMFLTGLAYLQRSDYTLAIKWLEPVSNNFKSPYRQQAEFYLALTYLKNEDYDRSIQLMEKITYTPTHPYRNRISENTISDIKMLKWK